jgi:carbonic anhydrase
MKHRRNVVVLLAAALACGGASWGLRAQPQPAKQEQPPKDAKAVLKELEAGNARFVASGRTRSTDTRGDAAVRQKLAKEQHPIAAVLCCSDSRATPEFLFDQGVGRLFVIRNAGNLVAEGVLATLEYGVEHLHIPLIVVVGHTGCGAVAAVNSAGNKALPGHFKDFQDKMADLKPLLKKPADTTPEFVSKLSGENARHQAARLLRQSEPLREAVKKKRLAVAVGMYDLATGVVTILDRGGLDR